MKVGAGAAEGTQMGPLAHARRVDAIDGFVRDAIERGGTLACGGERAANQGFFYAPTVLTDVPLAARIM
ncbi:aldehyde dehydrogenase family protein, partial [Stenotrophomonas maltophilia]|uniref:aldehyde dehydrogenase family protein n=1 Tax=Stenotrophomonas maltophilia TaxID=40324 RepID=UPI003CCFE627